MKNIKLLLLLTALVSCGSVFAQVTLTNAKNVNGDELDFSPVPYKDGVIYTTSKSTRFLTCPSDNPERFTDLKFAKRNADGTFGDVDKLRGDVNGRYNDGVATFNDAATIMIFSRNNKEGKNEADSINLKLYTAELEGDKWKKVTELPFNSDDFNTCHPTLSKDGGLLIFSSNRPGGYGGMDLYSSKYENGTWTAPVNLGTSVNSDGNELFPFLDEHNNLFFSSNGHGGQGGLDLFAAKTGSAGNWELVGALDDPFNKAGDDVTFVSLKNGEEGYITTDREGGEGLDDIYYWKRTPEPLDGKILVVDECTGLPLPGANVKVEMTQIGSVLDAVYQDADQMVQELSGNDGSVMLQLVRNSNYSVAVDKPEYTPATRQATTNQLKTPEIFTVAIKKTNYGCRVVGKVVEEGTNTPIANASVQVKNTATGQMTSLTADASGGFQSMVECGQSYEFTATQQNFEGGNATVSVVKEDCKVAEKQVTLELGPALVVMLEPIFFDFDRYYIRNIDAIPTMDSLVIIMNYYPSLHVKLTGACDSRGPVSYNDILAQKRAASAKKYLMGKGISENRITTAAVGERGLVNKCDDKTPCSEAQHQLNRRVDVSATQSNEKGVLFKTRPIGEMKVITRFRP